MTPETKQRRREKKERKLAEYRAAVAVLRSDGKSCSNCQHWGHAPLGMKDRICELDSDSDGYVVARSDHVCTHHDLNQQKTQR